MLHKVTITTEMTTGQKFTDTLYCDEFDNAFLWDIIIGKTERRGFKISDIDKYIISIIAE